MAKARRNREDNGTTADVPVTDEQRDGAMEQQDRIAARAYELYLERGGTDGQAWDDWLAAERELANDQPGSNRTE